MGSKTYSAHPCIWTNHNSELLALNVLTHSITVPHQPSLIYPRLNQLSLRSLVCFHAAEILLTFVGNTPSSKSSYHLLMHPLVFRSAFSHISQMHLSNFSYVCHPLAFLILSTSEDSQTHFSSSWGFRVLPFYLGQVRLWWIAKQPSSSWPLAIMLLDGWCCHLGFRITAADDQDPWRCRLDVLP